MDPQLSPLFQRRSIRKFTSEIIDKTDIKNLLEAAMAAPSTRTSDPWNFIVFSGTLCSQIAPALSNGRVLISANNGVLVCADMNKAYDGQVSFALQDCSAAIENFLIAASIKGFGACWMGIHPREERIKKVRKVFKLTDNMLPISLIALGVSAEKQEPRTRFDENKVVWLGE